MECKRCGRKLTEGSAYELKKYTLQYILCADCKYQQETIIYDWLFPAIR